MENRIASTLKRLHNDGHIDENTRDFLTPRYSSAPQIYGLPKVHKEGTPMRPIVSAIGSPSYNLAKELARILTPLAGNTLHSVKNSSAFVERVSVMELEARDRLVSFDVTNLFTQIPVDEALKSARGTAIGQRHTDREDQYPCAPTDRAHRNMPADNLFLVPGHFIYEQLDGAAMGSPFH